MNRTIRFITLSLIILSTSSVYAEVSLTASYEYADISGYRTYNAYGFTKGSETTSRYVPRVSLRTKMCEFAEIGISYAYLDNLTSRGISPNSNIFPSQGIHLTVVTPYKVEEEIQDVTLFAGFTLDLKQNISLSAGPELHYLISEARFYTYTFQYRLYRKIKSYDWEVGGYGMLRYNINEDLHLQVSYRFIKPPGRDIHFFGFGIGFDF